MSKQYGNSAAPTRRDRARQPRDTFWDRPLGKWMNSIAGQTTMWLTLVAVVVAIVGTSQTSELSPLSASDTPSSSKTPGGGCLSYVGDEAAPSASVNYDDSQFVEVDCRLPHEYEIIDREADVTCDQAVYRLLNTAATPGYSREKIAALGPTGCVLGRRNGDNLQSDTFRISATRDPIQTFGACTLPEDADEFLLGGLDFARDLPCKSEMMLPSTVISDSLAEKSPQENCEDMAEGLYASAVLAADASDEYNMPAVRCLFVLERRNEG